MSVLVVGEGKMKLSDVSEHVVLDRALHRNGLTILILNTSVTAITSMTGHLLTQLFVQLSQSLVLLGLLRLRLRC